MIKFSVMYEGENNIDGVIAEDIQTECLPRVGEYIILDNERNGCPHTFVVTSVYRSYPRFPEDNIEYNTIDVVKYKITN